MAASPLDGMTDTSLRAWWERRRRVIIPVIALLAAAGGLLAWGPIGVGPGPIGNWTDSGGMTGLVSRTQPTVLVESIDAGNSGAVIDSIAVVSDGRYPAPHVVSIRGDGDQVCGGAWPLTGRQNFYADCAAGGLVPLLGRAVPANSPVNEPGQGSITYPGIGAAIEAAPPGPAGCWTVTTLVIHYHVGIRHYTAAHIVNVTECSSQSQLAALRRQD
ncbi:MAG: hypothetical protein ACLQFR_13100 [Streptosporangiaceae bacterium]